MPTFGGRLSTPASATAKPEKKEGLLGKIGGFLGVGNLTEDLLSIPAGIGNLATSVLPGGRPAGEVWSQAGRGIASSLLSTAATPFAAMGDRNPIERFGDRFLGEGSVQDLYERTSERGLLSSLFEDVGNVALGAGAAGSVARSAGAAGKVAAANRIAKTAKAAGMTDEALAAAKAVGRGSDRIRAGLKTAGADGTKLRGGTARKVAKYERRATPHRPFADPRKVGSAERLQGALHTGAHPYVGLARGTRQLTGAAQKLNIAKALPGPEAADAQAAGRRVAGSADQAEAMAAPLVGEAPRTSPLAEQIQARRAEGISPTAEKAVAKLPGLAQSGLAKAEGLFQGREVKKVTRQMDRVVQGEVAKMTGGKGAQAARRAIEAVQRNAEAAGKPISLDEANRMVGDAIQSQMKQTAFLRNVAEGAGVDAATASKLAGIEHFLPEEYVDDAVRGDIATAVAELTPFVERGLNKLRGSRYGDEGLEYAEAEEVLLNQKDQARLKAIEDTVNKALTKRDKAAVANMVATAKRAIGLTSELQRTEKKLQRALEKEARARKTIGEIVMPENQHLSLDELADMTTGQLSQRLRARPDAGTRAEKRALQMADRFDKQAVKARGRLAELREKYGLQDGETLTSRPTSTFRGESKAQFGKRSKQLALDRAEMRRLEELVVRMERAADKSRATVKPLPEMASSLMARARQVQKAVTEAQEAQKVIDRTTKVLEDLTASQAKLDEFFLGLEGGAESALGRELLKASGRAQRAVTRIEGIGGARVAAKWKPFFEGLKDMREYALEANNPQLSEALAAIPERVSEVFTWAREAGMNPSHVSSMTPGQVEKLVKGQLSVAERIGQKSGRRKARNIPETLDRSVDALSAAWGDVVLESQKGALVDFLTGGINPVARRLEDFGGEIPDGWVLWDPDLPFQPRRSESKLAEDTARALRGGAPGPEQYVVPKSVANGLASLNKNYDFMLLRGIRKVTQPWRAFVLTLTPRWYVNNAVGNFILSTSQGVSPADWAAAWQVRRASVGKKPLRALDAMPGVREKAGAFADQLEAAIEGRVGQSIYEDLGTVEDLAEAKVLRQQRVRVRKAANALQKANTNIDEISRLSVYMTKKAQGYSDDIALQRAHEALVDYADLGPVEKALVRSVIPFYAWQKGIMKVAAKYPLDHPGRATLMMQLGQLQQDLQEGLPEYYRRGLIEDIPGLGSLQAGSMIPFADADSLLSPEGIAGSSNPFVELLVRDAFDAPAAGYPDGYRVDRFGRAVPDVDITDELFGSYGVLGGIPQLRTMGGLRDQETPPSEAVGSFFGVRTMSPERRQELIERQAKAGAKAANLSAGDTRAAVRAVGGDAPEPTREQSSRSRLRALGIELPEIPDPAAAVRRSIRRATQIQ